MALAHHQLSKIPLQLVYYTPQTAREIEALQKVPMKLPYWDTATRIVDGILDSVQ